MEFGAIIDGSSFVDLSGDDGSFMLASRPFTWMTNFRLRYHVSWHGAYYLIGSYMSFLFAHQFGYGQLYVGNANPKLCAQCSLLDGVRAWFYSIARGTRYSFVLPPVNPRLHRSLSFCHWYLTAAQILGFEDLTSFMAYLEKKVTGGRICWKVNVSRCISGTP